MLRRVRRENSCLSLQDLLEFLVRNLALIIKEAAGGRRRCNNFSLFYLVIASRHLLGPFLRWRLLNCSSGARLAREFFAQNLSRRTYDYRCAMLARGRGSLDRSTQSCSTRMPKMLRLCKRTFANTCGRRIRCKRHRWLMMRPLRRGPHTHLILAATAAGCFR